MSAKRKGISQREAMRNRRDLRRLRAFVDSIAGNFEWTGDAVLSWSVNGMQALADVNGRLWGTRGAMVLLGRVDSSTVSLRVVRVPEATP